MMSFRIAWAKAGDAISLVPLLIALYKHDTPEAPEPTCEVVERHVARLLEPETPHRLAVLWSDDDRAIGLAAVARFLSVSDPRPQRWTQIELKELFVLPDWRSAGFGRALMSWIEMEARATGACHRLARQEG
jgi:GNAT superfamily N-acetyltransferase